jgi:hypothetical protein
VRYRRLQAVGLFEAAGSLTLGVNPANGPTTVNVTEDALRDYIELFHETLDATAKQFLPEEHRRSLLHASLLPARIVGYISTQFGAGIEYTPSAHTEICIVRGSSRVEDLLVQAPPQARVLGPMLNVREGPGAFHDPGGVFRLTLEGGFPFRLLGPNAVIRFGEVVFKIGPWHRDVEYAEIFGNRTREFWSKEQAITRWMTAGASITSNVVLEQAYDEANLDEAIATAVKWAEEKISALDRKFDGLFPWRMRVWDRDTAAIGRVVRAHSLSYSALDYGQPTPRRLGFSSAQLCAEARAAPFRECLSARARPRNTTAERDPQPLRAHSNPSTLNGRRGASTSDPDL